MRRLRGKIVRRMIGQYPVTTLAKAREGALEALRDFERGRKERGQGARGCAPAGQFLFLRRRGIYHPACG
jgi:hypothetical protein